MISVFVALADDSWGLPTRFMGASPKLCDAVEMVKEGCLSEYNREDYFLSVEPVDGIGFRQAVNQWKVTAEDQSSDPPYTIELAFIVEVDVMRAWWKDKE